MSKEVQLPIEPNGLSVQASNAKRKVWQYMDVIASFPTAAVVSPGERGAIIGILNQYCSNDASRKAVLAWLFSDSDVPYGLSVQKSTTDLTDFQWWALHQWIRPYKDDEQGWIPEGDFSTEIVAVLAVVFGGEPSMLEMAINIGGKLHPASSYVREAQATEQEILADDSKDEAAANRIADLKKKYAHLF